MTLRVLSAAMMLSALATSLAHADSDIPENVLTVANEAGIDPVDLLGATLTTGLEPHTYVCLADGLLCPEPAQTSGRKMTVRLTYYVENGFTASGGHTYVGSTACSYNFPFGTRFRVAGEVFTCNDRGRLGSTGWLDLWRRPDIAKTLGSYATVEVLP